MNILSNKNKTVLIYLVFLMSGSAALIFEGLWFHLAGLIVGNSIIAAATVLSAFMAGLALGNFLVTKYAQYIKNTIRLYVLLEIIIGFTGISSILIMPLLPELTAPLLLQLRGYETVLTLVRFFIVFIILFIPTTAMGMTLPILVRELCINKLQFGESLGHLYGLNTFGAVAGILVSEFYLIHWFGIQRTGLIAGSFNFIIALIIFNKFSLNNSAKSSLTTDKPKLNILVLRLLLAAFLSGAILLGLEIIWFRFLLLSTSGTSEVFSIMLACVLAGIGLGGLLAGILYKYQFSIENYLQYIYFICLLTCITTYISFFTIFNLTSEIINDSLLHFAFNAMLLIIPNAILSGLIFTAIGKAVYKHYKYEINSAGLLTLCNTLGAMAGAILSSFILLPYLGVEKSILFFGILYFILSFVVPFNPEIFTKNKIYLIRAVSVLLFLSIVFIFPHGHLYNKYYLKLADKWNASSIVKIKEGLSATNLYFQYNKFGQPHHYRLMTNSYSMSGTTLGAERYMKLFAYFPMMLNSNIKDALLISYGVGMTAKALTNIKQLKSIDVVDISEDALELSRLLFTDETHPLDDPRVNIFIEDGRFHLLTSEKKYDLITGEPPPPTLHKIVNLYSQEYFNLIYQRLNEGGIATYWLPVYQLHNESSKSVIKSFCNVFDSCSLWRSSGLEWMLVGSRGSSPAVNHDFFQKARENSEVSKDLINLGFENAGQINALFLADKKQLNEIIKYSKPLLDNYPKRIVKQPSINEDSVFFDKLMDINKSKSRFLNSTYINNNWPKDAVQNSLAYFETERIFTNIALPKSRKPDDYFYEDLYHILISTKLVTLPLLLLGSDYKEQEIVTNMLISNDYNTNIFFTAALKQISERNYKQTIFFIEQYILNARHDINYDVYALYLFVLCMEENYSAVHSMVNNNFKELNSNEDMKIFLKWLGNKFNLSLTRNTELPN